MKQFLKKVKSNILISTIIYLIMFVLIKLLLNYFNLEYMQWIEWFTLVIVPLGILVGTIQKLKKHKIVLVISVIAETLASIIICGYFLLLLLVDIEQIVYRDGKKMVKETHSFLFSNHIKYYDYKNIFVRGTNKRIYEEYDDTLEEYCYTSYYDENGKFLYTEYEDGSREENIWKSESSKEGTNDDTTISDNTEPTNEDNILYEKSFNENIAIRVVNYGYILAQRSIIGVEKTIDGGKTWENQIEMRDGYMQISNESEFVFLSENIGFINDPGLAGTNGENKGLLVTQDGGKTFEETTIVHPEDIEEETLFVSGVPYEEDGELKLKVYTINYNKNPQKTYYEFYSVDNGLNWSWSE